MEMNVWDIKPGQTKKSTSGATAGQPVSIWGIRDPLDPATTKPSRADSRDWEMSKFTGIGGKVHTILKSNLSESYLELSEQQAYVWDLMDGSRTISDLVVEVFLRFHTLSIESTSSFIEQLQARSLLSIPPRVNLYRSLDAQLSRKSRPTNYLKRLFGIILQSEFSIPGIDRMINGFYKVLGWLVFSQPVQILLLLATLIGVPFFIWM